MGGLLTKSLGVALEKSIHTHLPADNLSPHTHEFLAGDTPVIAEDGSILPPIAFSRNRFSILERLANESPQIFDDEPSLILASHLLKKGIEFDDENGCWKLPLQAEYDEKKRARYPQVSIPALSLRNKLAHRVTIEVFRGISIPKGAHVDHICRSHACCNPYHLEVVSSSENSRRGRDSRLALSGLMSFFSSQINPGATYAEIEKIQKGMYEN